MAYQHLWDILYQSHPCRKTVLILFITNRWWNKGVHAFPKGISLKVNVIVWLELKLAYYVVAVQYVNHCATGVTLCGWCTRQIISLSVLVRNQTMGLNLRSPATPELEEERKVQEKTGASWRRKTGSGVNNGAQRRVVGFELTVQRMIESTEVRKVTA